MRLLRSWTVVFPGGPHNNLLQIVPRLRNSGHGVSTKWPGTVAMWTIVGCQKSIRSKQNKPNNCQANIYNKHSLHSGQKQDQKMSYGAGKSIPTEWSYWIHVYVPSSLWNNGLSIVHVFFIFLAPYLSLSSSPLLISSPHWVSRPTFLLHRGESIRLKFSSVLLAIQSCFARQPEEMSMVKWGREAKLLASQWGYNRASGFRSPVRLWSR